MKLNDDLNVDQFREEMQHRVVRYPLLSRPVKEAVRFAKRHSDPAFYRIASDKVHAQRQYQRELYGPSRWERLVDFFTLGSLKEVVVTLLLVAGGVVGLDAAKRAMRPGPDEDLYAQMDVDALADRLGIAIESTRIRTRATRQADPNDPGADPTNQSPAVDQDSEPSAALSDADVSRIAEAVIERLAARESREETGAKAIDPNDDSPPADPVVPEDLAKLPPNDPRHESSLPAGEEDSSAPAALVAVSEESSGPAN